MTPQLVQERMGLGHHSFVHKSTQHVSLITPEVTPMTPQPLPLHRGMQLHALTAQQFCFVEPKGGPRPTV